MAHLIKQNGNGDPRWPELDEERIAIPSIPLLITMEPVAEMQQPFTWWPRTPAGSRVLSGILIVGFFYYLSSDEFGAGNKFYFAVRSTTLLFFVCAAVRYGYLKVAGKLTPVAGRPWWQNRGSIAVVVVVLMALVFRPTTSDEGTLRAKFQTGMNADKQTLFNWVHPVGTAKSITVHDVSVTNGPDGRQAVVRFTIAWQGPVTKDGFTKVRGIYDFEAGRWVSGEVLSTNGITNSQTLDGISEFIGGFVEGALKD